jgi:hypothetical protein
MYLDPEAAAMSRQNSLELKASHEKYSASHQFF